MDDNRKSKIAALLLTLLWLVGTVLVMLYTHLHYEYPPKGAELAQLKQDTIMFGGEFVELGNLPDLSQNEQMELDTPTPTEQQSEQPDVEGDDLDDAGEPAPKPEPKPVVAAKQESPMKVKEKPKEEQPKKTGPAKSTKPEAKQEQVKRGKETTTPKNDRVKDAFGKSTGTTTSKTGSPAGNANTGERSGQPGISGLVGYTNQQINFKSCIFDPFTTPLQNELATLVRMKDGVECSFDECYYTQSMGTPQGTCIFTEVQVPEGCTVQIVSEPFIKLNGENYYTSGTEVSLTVPEGTTFDHWNSPSGCFISDPWTADGVHTLADVHSKPTFEIATVMPTPVTADRTMDGTVYRYLCQANYHLYLSNEYIAEKGYQFDSDGELYKDVDGTKVWVTAVVGWEPGKIPSDGAQIHNDLVGDWSDHTLTACIAPHAFEGCNELQTLYFKDTDANNYNAKTQFDFVIGDLAFANCPNLTEIKMMQYTTEGTNHWEALRPEQVGYVAADVFQNSPNAYFSTDASLYQSFLSSQTWADLQRRIIIYNHTDVDFTVNGAKYSQLRSTSGQELKNSAEDHATLIQMLRSWNADYQEFTANNLLSTSSENVWYTTIVGYDDDYLKSNDGVMRIYNDPGAYYNYKTIAITRNAFKGSKELRAIEFGQTNGRSSNSYDGMKMVIQNGAFANCDSLKELRMYYYCEDGDNHWEVLGPRDVIPGDNIFGITPEDQPIDFETASFIPSDFKILVAPEMYTEFINDPNWSQYVGYIEAREYAPTEWDAITEGDLVYDYASKTVNTASTNQVVTQNLSWWNVPIKIYEFVTLVELFRNLTELPARIKAAVKKVKGYLKDYDDLVAITYESNGNIEKMGDHLLQGDLSDLDYMLSKNPNNFVTRGHSDIKDLVEAGILQNSGIDYGTNVELKWTEGAKELIMNNPEKQKLLGRCVKTFVVLFRENQLIGNAKYVRKQIVDLLKKFSSDAVSAYLANANTMTSLGYSSYMALGSDMTNEQLQRGLNESIKARIHDVTYDNTLIFTPDKKLIYHVYVDKPAEEKKSYTIYHDIGDSWNYRTVAIKKNAFQNNETLEEIKFAEGPYKSHMTYVPMLLAIPDSAFAGCTNLQRFDLIYTTQDHGPVTNNKRGLGPENFILGGEHIFDGCDSTKLQIIIPEDRKEDFLADELWSQYKRFFKYEAVPEVAQYTEYGANYAIYYENNTTPREERVSGHTITHLTAISADNEFLDEHQGSMALFNDIGSYNNYKLDLAKKKAFAGNEHLRTVSFWDLNGGDAYTQLSMALGDSCFINCPNLKNIDMLYCVTDGTDRIEPLKPSQVRPGSGLFEGSPDCIIKMLPQQLAWFENDSEWQQYKDRFVPCIIQPADDGVTDALKDFRYYTPCCSPNYWDGFIDLARIAGANYEGVKEALQEYRDDILSFADFKQFEAVGLDHVGREWFRNFSKMTNILLPSTLKTIEEYAFTNCSALQEIELPDSLTKIDSWAFGACANLKTIVVRNTVPAKLGPGAFPTNEGMRIYVPAQSLNDYLTAWAEYKDYIASDATNPFSKVVTVTQPDQLAEKLGLTVEFSYSGLNYGSEPRYLHGNYAKYDSLTVIGPLGNVDLAVIRYMAGSDAYEGGGKATDGKLRYLNLYNAQIKETDDGYNYYNDQSSMTGRRYKIISDNVLPAHLFRNCTALQSVVLPKSITEFKGRMFAGCSSLKSVAVTGTIDDYDEWTHAGGLLDYPLEELVFVTDQPAQSSCKNPWGQTIGTVITKQSQIDDYMGQPYLTNQAQNIIAPFEDDAVMKRLAEKGEFFPSSYLERESVEGLFTETYDLQQFNDFDLFQNVRKLGDESFGSCYDLKTISLPDSLKEISARAFENCVSLDTIYVSCDSVPLLAEDAFKSLPKDFRILVPKSLCKLYREKWAQYADHINVYDEEYADNLLVVNVEQPNTLAKALGLEATLGKSMGNFATKVLTGVRGNYSNITRLKVNGPLGGSDFDLLRYLAGYCPWTFNRNYAGHLEYLDLYDAWIVDDGECGIRNYYRNHNGTTTETTVKVEANTLPTHAFLRAYSLKTLILPRSCTKVHTRALQECENLEVLVVGDDMEDFNWSALDDNVSLTRMYILAKQKMEFSSEFAVWRWLCNNYNPTFDAFYVRPSLYKEYISDDDYTGSSWQRTNNISCGAFDEDESFCAFASHGAATADDLRSVYTVDGWFNVYRGAKDLSMLSQTVVDSLSKATLAPLTQLEGIALPFTLKAMEDSLFAGAKKLRYVDFMDCDSTDVVAPLRDGGLQRLGINTEQTLVYMPETYGQTDEANVVVETAAGLQAHTFSMADTLDYCVPYSFTTRHVTNQRVLMPKANMAESKYTVSLPYDIDVPAGAKAYKLEDRNGNKLIFHEEQKRMKANTPYLMVLTNGNVSLNSNLEQEILSTPEAESELGRNQMDVPGFTMRGTLKAIDNQTANELGAYILQSDNKWHEVPAGVEVANIPAYRCYLLQNGGTGNVKALDMELVGDETDGIDTIVTIDRDGNENVYDLQGRMIQSNKVTKSQSNNVGADSRVCPLPKGVYIYKGKKYVNK